MSGENTFDSAIRYLRKAQTQGQKPGQAPAPPLTVEKSIVLWRKLQGIGKKATTLLYHEELEGIIRVHWPDLKLLVEDVTESQCIDFAKKIEHYSAPRYNSLVNALRRIIPQAIIIPRRRVISVPKCIPTADEFKRLLAALDVAQQGNANLVIRLLAQTGMRINEACQLKWEHVRDDHLFLPGENTKNGKPRCVPFVKGTEEVIHALRRIPKYQHKRPGYVLPQVECKTALNFACRLAGVGHVSHHSFRHYFATRCIQSGVDIPTIAKWLGHSDSGALLLRTYCHLIDEHTTEMAKRVKVGGLSPDNLQAVNVVALDAGLRSTASELTSGSESYAAPAGTASGCDSPGLGAAVAMDTTLAAGA